MPTESTDVVTCSQCPPICNVFMIVNHHDPVELSRPLPHHSVTQLLLDKITILSYAPSPPLPCPTHLNQPWPSHGGHTMTVMHIIIGGGPPSPWGSAHWPPDKGWKCPVRGRGLAGPTLGWRALRPPPGRDKTQQGFLHANRHDPWTPHKEHHFRSYGHSVWESKEEPMGAGWGLGVPLRESDHWLYRGKKQESRREKKRPGVRERR